MGHANIETTMDIYAEVTDAKKKEAIENLSPIIRYYPIFAAFLKSIIKYYSVSCRQNS